MTEPLLPQGTSRKILGQIRARGLQPIPRTWFLLKRWLIWASLAGFTVIGCFSMALLLSDFSSSDFGPQLALRRGGLRMALSAIPYLWLATLAVFAALAFRQVRHTPKGYRHSSLKITVSILAISLLGGALMNAAGLDRKLERKLARSLLPVRELQQAMQARWMNPDAGFLMGELLDWKPSDPLPPTTATLNLQDTAGTVWTVRLEHAQWRGLHRIAATGRIRLVGRRLSEREFAAELILPWPGPGMRRHSGMGPHRLLQR